MLNFLGRDKQIVICGRLTLEEEGDYEYFNYVDFEEAILELDTPSEEDVDDEAEEDNEVEDLAVEDLGDTTSVDERIQNL